MTAPHPTSGPGAADSATASATGIPVPRRAALGWGPGVLLAGALAGCAEREPRPSERGVNLGFESLVQQEPEWNLLRQRLVDADANAISVCVGRTDWVAFPWAAHPDAVLPRVRASGRDLAAEAIAALTGVKADTDPGRNRPLLTVTIDALCPALIAQHPDIAGKDDEGMPSASFAGVNALAAGIAGDRLVELTREVCRRYSPDRIALTEFLFDDHTFGDDDLAHYRSSMRRSDWPRTRTGAIDTGHRTIGQWRSLALAALIGRLREVTDGFGTEVDVDVRAPWNDPDGDRAESGHDYDVLLTAAHRIVVWNYTGLSDGSVRAGGRIAASLAQRHPGRFVMSTGLWADSPGDHPTRVGETTPVGETRGGENASRAGEEPARDGGDSEPIERGPSVSPSHLGEALRAVAQNGADAVSVTPASMLTDEHWRAVRRAWSD